MNTSWAFIPVIVVLLINMYLARRTVATRSLQFARLARPFSTDKDITYVDLNNPENSAESAAATNHFFEYQTGRWLTNDRAERKARAVKFDLKGLAELLQNSVSVTQNKVEIETLEPLFEGKHNKLYKIALKDRRSYVLRIPYEIGLSDYRTARLQSEAATLTYLSEHVFTNTEKFRAAAPISYSATSDNTLKTPYMLSSFVEGTKLAAEWKPWLIDIDEKRSVIEPMAEMASTILKHKFPAYGSIFFADDVPQGYDTVKINERFVVGPSMEKRFWRSEVSKPFRGPFKTWQDYLKATGDVQVAYAKSKTGDDSPNTKSAERYAKLTESLFTSEMLSGEKASPRLFDPDLSPLNVISQDNEKFWLLDVENTAIKPYVLHGIPWFVRNPGERVYSVEDVQGYENMPEEQKQIVQHMLSLTQNEYTFERLLRDQIPELISAHHPNLKRREEVVHRAMNTDITSGFYNDLNFSMLKVLQLWKILAPNTEPPFKFSDAESEQLVSDMMEWNTQLVRNRFLESKGFVPADLFDKLLGTGALKVIDETIGNYELTEEFLQSQDPFRQRD